MRVEVKKAFGGYGSAGTMPHLTVMQRGPMHMGNPFATFPVISQQEPAPTGGRTVTGFERVRLGGTEILAYKYE